MPTHVAMLIPRHCAGQICQRCRDCSGRAYLGAHPSLVSGLGFAAEWIPGAALGRMVQREPPDRCPCKRETTKPSAHILAEVHR